MIKKGSARWKGGFKEGGGTISTETGVLRDAPYGFKSRFEDGRKNLIFVGRVAPRVVFLGHGDEPSRQWFEQKIRERYPKIKIHQPQPGVAVEA